MGREKISYVDYAWLRANHPDNLMVITGLITFSSPLDYERMKGVVEALTQKFPRFRQRLIPALLPMMRPYWEDVTDFDIESHLLRVTLPTPADQTVLQGFISRMLSVDLDGSRPLWQFYVVENYHSSSSSAPGSALVVRLHHALADGIALVHVLLSMTEKTPQPEEKGHLPEHLHIGKEDHPSSSRLPGEEWIKGLIEKGTRLVSNPDYARQAARFGADFAVAVGKLALRPPDPQTLFKGQLGREKRAAWSQPFDLTGVKRTGRAFGCTVNDVLLSAMAGALGRYIHQRGRSPEGLSIRGVIPVNLRQPEEGVANAGFGSFAVDESLGNDFGLVFLSLPIGIDDPVERLRRLKKNMDGLKSSKEPLASYVILQLIGAVPASVEDLAFAFFDTKGTTIMTNVPGPRHQLYMACAPIEMLMAWVPQSGRVALGVSIISYNNKVWVGVATDQGLAPDPEQIVALFGEEYREFSARAEAVLAKRYQDVRPVMNELEKALQNLDEWLKSQ
jgi:diacylglycerol O-acyltransferase